MEKRTTSKEMLNVVLSDDTKLFLVAHRMIEEVGVMIADHMIDVYGYDSEEITPFWNKAGDLQNDILNFMKHAIGDALVNLEVTEI